MLKREDLSCLKFEKLNWKEIENNFERVLKVKEKEKKLNLSKGKKKYGALMYVEFNVVRCYGRYVR